MEAKPSEKMTNPKPRDFLNHLETYLAKRDGVDKLLKISRYTTKIILASSLIPHPRNQSPDSPSQILRIKRRSQPQSLPSRQIRTRHQRPQSLAVAGLEPRPRAATDTRLRRRRIKMSAWAELVGYVGSVSLKVRDLREIKEEEACVASTIEISVTRGIGCVGEEEKMRKLKEKKTMKVLSVLQDLADGLMAVADVRDGKVGVLSAPSVIASAGLFSAIISTHKD
ncbi:unnamed protein product [Brassica napus]|uniref:(rape) hypothetical protein n=1 Tax=Brassica napus TaxID=3708 RepID=A0A816UBR6_BRANA|nr:unnamed protein product [Brassica napus]